MLGQGALCQWNLGEPEEIGASEFTIAGASTVGFTTATQFDTMFKIAGRSTVFFGAADTDTPGNAYFSWSETTEACFYSQDSALASFDVEPSATVAVAFSKYAYIKNGSTTPKFSVEVGHHG